jgi:uncharacterized protein (DUF2336 family)
MRKGRRMGSPAEPPAKPPAGARAPDTADAKAAALTRLCVLKPLPDPVLSEVDAALTAYLAEAMEHVRAEVAARLADCDWAPLEAVRLLAFDAIDIARPVLERSRRLAEGDLEALAELDRDRRCALARRPVLSERLTVAIARRREPECLIELAGNPGARLSDASASDFAAVARGASALQRRLADRRDLRPSLARALMAVAGDAVKAELAARWPDLDADRLDSAFAQAVAEQRPEDPGADPGDEYAAEHVVDTLARRGLLRAADLVRAAEAGRDAAADQVAARLTGLEPADWRRALARSPLRAALLCARAAALQAGDAARLYAGFAAGGRAHALGPDRLASACEEVYARYDRDGARRALHRLGADASMG